MRKLKIVMAYSALELVPREIASHPQVRKYAERRNKPPTKVLLDKSFHYHAMKKLKEKEKRGRPDIVFMFLAAALSSPLNVRGLLEVYVHTRDDLIIFVNPKAKPIRSYERFLGIMEQLFEYGKVPPDSDEPLLWIKNMTLEYLVKKVIGADGVILVDPQAPLCKPKEIALKATELPVVVGGFPRGDYGLEAYKLAKKRCYIFPSVLDYWIVADRIIASYEELVGVYG